MVPPDLIRAVQTAFGCEFQTVYGQTESSPLLTQFLHGDTAFAQMTGARHLSTRGIFGAYRFTIATTCRLARLPEGDFYVQASCTSVTLRAAGYDYGGN